MTRTSFHATGEDNINEKGSLKNSPKIEVKTEKLQGKGAHGLNITPCDLFTNLSLLTRCPDLWEVSQSFGVLLTKALKTLVNPHHC